MNKVFIQDKNAKIAEIYIYIFLNPVLWRYNILEHKHGFTPTVSLKEGVQILTCFQMNKSGPLQVISKLVTSDRLLMHVLWSSLSSRRWDFGCSVITLKRGIWLPSGLCCLSAAQNIFSETRQKLCVSLLVFHVFCIETFMSNNPLPHIHTHTHKFKKVQKISTNIQLRWN